jgi:hypothetical protein
MPDREQRNLRGPVKSCTEQNTYGGMTDGQGKTIPESHSEYTTEYDVVGRVIAIRHGDSGGPQWVMHYGYDSSGRLLKMESGNEGQTLTATTYSYDHQGRLQKIINEGNDSPVTFRYDDRGQKTKIATCRSEDYRPGIAEAGSPFDSADRAPNLPGGGTATTTYDEHERATEVQVRNANGEIVKRAVRTYDAPGHIAEEKQILDDPVKIFPPDTLATMLEKSGLSANQLQQELRTQFTKLMGGNSGPYSVSYSYDVQGRVTHTSRRIFNHEDEIETTYNQQGDIKSEITRSTRLPGASDPTPAPASPSYSETSYSYRYDQQGNWIEKAASYRSSPDGEFQSSTVTKHKLTYY